LFSQGRVPTYNDVPSGAAVYIQAYPLSPNDVGKTITLLGVDYNGQPLTHVGHDGKNWPGTVITLASPFGISVTTVARIDAVEKEVTQMNVPIYALNPTTGAQLDLAVYEPGETNPSYAKDRLFAVGHPFCGCPFPAVALVKLAFVPVEADVDFVMVPSLNALKKAIQSIKSGEANNIQEQEAFLASAVSELNHVLENEEQPEQIAVSDTMLVRRQRIY
jgi:hypothetical protein